MTSVQWKNHCSIVHPNTHTSIYIKGIYLYLYIYMCVCVYVCDYINQHNTLIHVACYHRPVIRDNERIAIEE